MNKCENTGQAAIFQTANHLAELLRACPEYIRYMDAKERLFSDPLNRTILDDLRQKQLAMENVQAGDEELAKQEKFLDDFMMSIALNPVVNDYLNAEYNFGRIVEKLGDIFDQIFPDDNLPDEFDVFAPDVSASDNSASGEVSYIN